MKRHFVILHGFRGTAALLVVAFHLMEASLPKVADNPLHHAYLAVDFFFLLSGLWLVMHTMTADKNNRTLRKTAENEFPQVCKPLPGKAHSLDV